MIGRRGFIRSLVGLAIAPAAAALAPLARAVLPRGFLPVQWTATVTPAVLNDNFYAFVHPSAYADLVAMNRRGEWDSAYRRARKAGDRDLAPREILAKYPVDILKPEIGNFESFRFIESGNLSNI